MCKECAKRVPGECNEMARREQESCKGSARRLQRRCKEIARRVQRGCKASAKRVREDCEEGARKLQGGSPRGRLRAGGPRGAAAAPGRVGGGSGGTGVPELRSSAPGPALPLDARPAWGGFPGGVRPQRPRRSPGNAPRAALHRLPPFAWGGEPGAPGMPPSCGAGQGVQSPHRGSPLEAFPSRLESGLWRCQKGWRSVLSWPERSWAGAQPLPHTPGSQSGRSRCPPARNPLGLSPSQLVLAQSTVSS